MSPFDLNPQLSTVIVILIAWEFFCKGFALWRAVNLKQRNWFIIMLLPINTVGILELLYLFFFAKKRLTMKEIKSWFVKEVS